MEPCPITNQCDRAYQTIREDIVSGRYRPGQRLVESDIALRTGVSRTPVRQALHLLEREGVVRIEARRGATVRELSPQQISDLYELRAQLEGLACQLAASRATTEDRSELQRIALSFETAVHEHSGDDLSDIRSSNAELHRKVAACAQNPFLALALDTTIENPLVLRAYQKYGAIELERSVVFHQLIVQSICEGQGDRAGCLMREHVLQARDTLVASIESPCSAVVQ